MIRTQIQLTDEQAEQLKRLAAERGTSMAEVIRQALEDHVWRSESARRARSERAASVIGRYRSGRSDISAHHDDEAWGDPHGEGP